MKLQCQVLLDTRLSPSQNRHFCTNNCLCLPKLNGKDKTRLGKMEIASFLTREITDQLINNGGRENRMDLKPNNYLYDAFICLRSFTESKSRYS